MRALQTIIIIFILFAGATAHTINYHVENKGISARIFYDANDPAGYASYEIFGPADTLVFQKGRTDRNGVVSFLPDRKGMWVIKVYDESEHGMHAAQVEVNVNESLFMDDYKKPLVAKYTKGFVGISILLAFFGVWSMVNSMKKKHTS